MLGWWQHLCCIPFIHISDCWDLSFYYRPVVRNSVWRWQISAQLSGIFDFGRRNYHAVLASALPFSPTILYQCVSLKREKMTQKRMYLKWSSPVNIQYWIGIKSNTFNTYFFFDLCCVWKDIFTSTSDSISLMEKHLLKYIFSIYSSHLSLCVCIYVHFSLRKWWSMLSNNVWNCDQSICI